MKAATGAKYAPLTPESAVATTHGILQNSKKRNAIENDVAKISTIDGWR
jgi:hypothetical protein